VSFVRTYRYLIFCSPSDAGRAVTAFDGQSVGKTKRWKNSALEKFSAKKKQRC